MTERRLRLALLGAAACVLGLVATAALVRSTFVGQVHDNAGLYAFMRLGVPQVDRVSGWLISLGDPGTYSALGLVLVGTALIRGAPRVALAITVTLLASVISSELLKPLASVPRLGAAPGSQAARLAGATWPSGHATAVMTLALWAPLVVPRPIRAATAVLATVVALGAGYALLVLGWHFPSDVLGGYLMAGAWVSLGLAALALADQRWPARSGRRAVGRVARNVSLSARPLIAVAALSGLILLLAGVDAVGARPSFVVAFVAPAVVAACLAGLFAAASAEVSLGTDRAPRVVRRRHSPRGRG